MEDYSADQN